MKKKKITKKPPTRVHAFRCTDEVWLQLKTLAKECGISLNRYLTETEIFFVFITTYLSRFILI